MAMRVWGMLAVLSGCGPATVSFDDGDTDPDGNTVADTDVTEDTDTEDTEDTDTTWSSTDVAPPNFDCYVIVSSDDYADGQVEYAQVLAYDTDMYLIHSEFHYGPYGPQPLEVTDYGRDAAGNAIEETYDEIGDGVTDYRIARTYDDQGQLTEHTVDVYDDGTVDERVIYVWTGGVTDEITVDEGDDGTIDGRYVYTYDADGRVLTQAWDDGDDGSVESTTTYTYDSPAPSEDVAVEVDTDGDGDPEASYVLTYDGDGRMSSYLADEDGDGDFESQYFWTYNADGTVDEISGAIDTYYAGYGAMAYDFVKTHAYDGQGRQTGAETLAYFGPGPAGWWSTETWDWSCP